VEHKSICNCACCRNKRKEKHKLNCQCTLCKLKKGIAVNKSNWNFKHGKYSKDYKNYCIDCLEKEVLKEISPNATKCNSCAQKGEYNAGFIDGRTLEKNYCPDCGIEITYDAKRCNICDKLYRYENPKNHPRYVNGLSKEPYPLKFNEELKEKVRKRDNYTCKKCDITEEEHLIVYGRVLSIHHIDYNKNNNNEENLITLCNECNIRVNSNRIYWKEYFSKYLYKILNES
jgi:hypothetical protein